MKKILLITTNLVAFCLICGYAYVCSAQPVAGGFRTAAVTDPDIVLAANFAVVDRSETLLSIQDAKKQVVQGINYSLCLKVSNAGKAEEVAVVVYKNLKQEFKLTSWTAAKCSGSAETAPVVNRHISAEDLSGVWDYNGDLNTFVVKGNMVQRIITGPSEDSIKYYAIKKGEIDLVGVIHDNVIRGSQTLFIGLEFQQKCPGLTNTKIRNEITLSKDGKTLTIVRQDPFLELDNCWWDYDRQPVTEVMVKK